MLRRIIHVCEEEKRLGKLVDTANPRDRAARYSGLSIPTAYKAAQASCAGRGRGKYERKQFTPRFTMDMLCDIAVKLNIQGSAVMLNKLRRNMEKQLEDAGYGDCQLPQRTTIRTIMKTMGYNNLNSKHGKSYIEVSACAWVLQRCGQAFYMSLTIDWPRNSS